MAGLVDRCRSSNHLPCSASRKMTRRYWQPQRCNGHPQPSDSHEHVRDELVHSSGPATPLPPTPPGPHRPCRYHHHRHHRQHLKAVHGQLSVAAPQGCPSCPEIQGTRRPQQGKLGAALSAWTPGHDPRPAHPLVVGFQCFEGMIVSRRILNHCN